MDTNLFFQFLKRANSAGHHGLRLVGMKELPITAASDPEAQYVLVFDDGPKTASEDLDW